MTKIRDIRLYLEERRLQLQYEDDQVKNAIDVAKMQEENPMSLDEAIYLVCKEHVKPAAVRDGWSLQTRGLPGDPKYFQAWGVLRDHSMKAPPK